MKELGYTEVLRKLTQMRPNNYAEALRRLTRILTAIRLVKFNKEFEGVTMSDFPIGLLLGNYADLNQTLLKQFDKIYPYYFEPDEGWEDSDNDEEIKQHNENPSVFLYSASYGFEYEELAEAIGTPSGLNKSFELGLFFSMLTIADEFEEDTWQDIIEYFDWNIPIPGPHTEGHRGRFYELLNQHGLEIFRKAFEATIQDTGNEILDLSNSMIDDGGYGDWPPEMDDLPFLIGEWYQAQDWVKAYDLANEQFRKDRQIARKLVELWETANGRSTIQN